MDTGARGFAITGEEDFLQPLTSGRSDFPRHFNELQTLTADNPQQQEYLRQLQEHKQQWQRVYLEPLLAARRNVVGRTTTPDEIRRITDRGKPYTDAMRRVLADINHVEVNLLETRARSVTKHRAQTGALLLAGGAFAIMLVTVLSTLLIHNARKLSTANHELHAEVAERQTAMYSLREAYAVIERTRDEAEQAREEAEAANRAKSEFLSRMSHELRTPMNAILGFGQLLEMENLSAEQSDSVQQILKGGRHLLALINEVLDIARIESGKLSLSLEPVSITEVIREITQLVEPLAAGANVRLQHFSPSFFEHHVCADRQRLKQVLLNLLFNAIKYNREGGQVDFACQEIGGGAADSGPRLRISIVDNGPGLSESDIQKLFMPFVRLHAEQGGVEGTGLGLALAKSLVEAMKGHIGVESTLGEGSTFWVEFLVMESPLGEVSDSGNGKDIEADPSLLLTETASTRASTVLYIEDNLSNLRLIERLLSRRNGTKLISAMQGRMGVDLAREHHPDMILLDLHLPDINGDEVLLFLQADATTRDIPVVMLSADATPGQIERLLAAGARGYLTKPLDVKEFLEILEENLRDGGKAH